MTFGDSPGAGQVAEDGARPEEIEEPVQPETPAQQSPPPARPGPNGRDVQAPPATAGRPARMRKAPGYLRDYELTEMSIGEEVRRLTSDDMEVVGVGGMLDNDIPSTETRLREFTREPDSSRACADASSGRDRLSSGEVKTTCVRNVLIGMKDLCRKNGLNEVLTHYLVGRLAMDLCDSDPPNINSVV